MTRGEIWWVDFGVPFGSEVGFRRPVIVLQNQFAAFVQQIDKSKFIVKQQIANLQELLDYKMDQYFGE